MSINNFFILKPRTPTQFVLKVRVVVLKIKISLQVLQKPLPALREGLGSYKGTYASLRT